jgi:dTDP-L-rhamnose 4-epimerase
MIPPDGLRNASKQILITGGAGFLGSHLAQGLLAAGHRVRVLDERLVESEPMGRLESLEGGVEVVTGDIRDPHCLRQVLGGVEVLFHLAATARADTTRHAISHAMSVNTQGTAELLQVMLDEKLMPEKVIVASSMSLYGEGQYVCSVCSRPACPPVLARPTAETKHSEVQSIYALSKRTQEELCLIFGRTHGVPVTALRLFNVYGTGQSLANPHCDVATLFAARLLEDEAPLLFEDGEQMRDFVHVRDVVQANLLAMERPASNGEVINVGYGAPIRMRRVAELLAAALERPIAPLMTQSFRTGDIRHCYADLTKARKLLGYEPKVTHEQGLRELALWMAEEQGKEQSEDGTDATLQAMSQESGGCVSTSLQ